MLARDCGVYANRNPAAHEVRDDEGSLWCAFGDFPRNGKVKPPAGAPPHRHPSSGAPRQLPPGEARVLVLPASVSFVTLLSTIVPAARSAFSLRLGQARL